MTDDSVLACYVYFVIKSSQLLSEVGPVIISILYTKLKLRVMK